MGKFTENDILPNTARIINGMLAGFVMIDGKKRFRFIKMVDKDAVSRAAKSPRNYRKPLSKRGAKKAFEKYYDNRRYTSSGRRKQAKNRDKCHKNSSERTISDRRYRQSPLKWDYPGLDDGTSCPKKYTKTYYKPNKKMPTRDSKTGKFLKPAPKKGGGNNQSKKPVSLKTAVKLLRQYYAEKYN